MLWSVVCALIEATLLIGFIMAVPQALVHIGPHKTASSYIQSSLQRLSKNLTASNFYWPTYNGTVMGPKGVAGYCYAMREKRPETEMEIPKMIKFIHHSLHLKRNIILSAEDFSLMDSERIALLKKHLTGFNTTIVFVYRDVLSQFTSHHFEDNRFEHIANNYSVSFSTYVLSKFDQLFESLQPIKILDRYSAVFGQQQMRVIDLAGTTAAGRDVAHVVACETMGVLCNRTDLFLKPTFRNPRYSLIPAQVFSVYKTFVLQHARSFFCGSVLQEYRYFESRYYNHTRVHNPPANITSQLLPLRPFAEQVDRDLRAKYGAQMILANRTATLESMRRTNVTELHLEQFLQDEKWHEWIKEEFKVARAANRICHSSAPIHTTHKNQTKHHNS